MHLFDYSVNPLHKRPGRCVTGGVCLFVSARPVGTTVADGVQCLRIANDQIDAFESDLGMT